RVKLDTVSKHASAATVSFRMGSSFWMVVRGHQQDTYPDRKLLFKPMLSPTESELKGPTRPVRTVQTFRRCPGSPFIVKWSRKSEVLERLHSAFLKTDLSILEKEMRYEQHEIHNTSLTSHYSNAVHRYRNPQVL